MIFLLGKLYLLIYLIKQAPYNYDHFHHFDSLSSAQVFVSTGIAVTTADVMTIQNRVQKTGWVVFGLTLAMSWPELWRFVNFVIFERFTSWNLTWNTKRLCTPKDGFGPFWHDAIPGGVLQQWLLRMWEMCVQRWMDRRKVQYTGAVAWRVNCSAHS